MQSHHTYIISIHAPARGATVRQKQGIRFILYFNPRSRKGSDIPLLSLHTYRLYFNPRSRKGSDQQHSPLPISTYCISIHAPARGATKACVNACNYIHISIHAPARGATSVFHSIICLYNNFNPRSRKGSDAFALAVSAYLAISIHAPARGATSGYKTTDNDT